MSSSATVELRVKVRRLWLGKVALWLLSLIRVQTYANSRKIGDRALGFKVMLDDVELGHVEGLFGGSDG